jgi:hypothetical protein
LKPTARRWKNLKPRDCNAFAIYKLLANEEQLAAMTANYLETTVTVTLNKLCLN